MASKSVAVKTAKDPVNNPEVIKVSADTNQVACDGGHPSLGHPLTYYSFGSTDRIECKYCDRVFVLKAK